VRDSVLETFKGRGGLKTLNSKPSHTVTDKECPK
jgi:hypothetical protein